MRAPAQRLSLSLPAPPRRDAAPPRRATAPHKRATATVAAPPRRRSSSECGLQPCYAAAMQLGWGGGSISLARPAAAAAAAAAAASAAAAAAAASASASAAASTATAASTGGGGVAPHLLYHHYSQCSVCLWRGGERGGEQGGRGQLSQVGEALGALAQSGHYNGRHCGVGLW